jgi:hypothetical protein
MRKVLARVSLPPFDAYVGGADQEIDPLFLHVDRLRAKAAHRVHHHLTLRNEVFGFSAVWEYSCACIAMNL